MLQSRTRALAWLLAEFIVIVLGVLVALAVDEWRGSRANAKLERFFLEELAEDLAKDSSDYTNFGRTQRRRALAASISLGTELLAESRGSGSRTDTVRLSRAAGLALIGWTGHLEPSRAAYTTMSSTGGIAIISSPALRRSIVDYYLEVDDQIEINVELERNIEVYRRRLENHGFTPVDRENIQITGPLNDPALLALIRDMQAQANQAAQVADKLLPMALTLRREVLADLYD